MSQLGGGELCSFYSGLDRQEKFVASYNQLDVPFTENESDTQKMWEFLIWNWVPAISLLELLSLLFVLNTLDRIIQEEKEIFKHTIIDL